MVSTATPDIFVGIVAYEYDVGKQDEDERSAEILDKGRLVLLEPVNWRQDFKVGARVRVGLRHGVTTTSVAGSVDGSMHLLG